MFCLAEIFTDKNDTEWTNDQELVPIDLNKLSPRSFVAYRFGCFVVRLVAVHCGHKPVSLLIAEKIPVNEKLVRNAYRNSFHYDDLNHILYVREERLGSVGEFMLVIIHALAHIKAGPFVTEVGAYCHYTVVLSALIDSDGIHDFNDLKYG